MTDRRWFKVFVGVQVLGIGLLIGGILYLRHLAHQNIRHLRLLGEQDRAVHRLTDDLQAHRQYVVQRHNFILQRLTRLETRIAGKR